MQAVSTRQVESAVVSAPLDKIWANLRSLSFDKLFPGLVSGTTYVEGGVGKLESTVKINYKDAAWTVRVVELSDLNYHVVFELIETDPHVDVSSRIDTIRL